MIHYQLRCSQDHEFDGWFKDSAAFDTLAERGLVECPVCGDQTVNRALMAPALAGRSHAGGNPPAPPTAPEPTSPDVSSATPIGGRVPDRVRAMLQRLRTEVEKNCDYVGPRFAEEALRIHRGEVDPRGIYGETTQDQAESLAEEGVRFARIPWVGRAEG